MWMIADVQHIIFLFDEHKQPGRRRRDMVPRRSGLQVTIPGKDQDTE